VTLDQFQRAQLFGFAYQQALHTGSIAAMKAVAYVIRNRVVGGWHHGSWIDAIQRAGDVSGNEPTAAPLFDCYSQTFQILARSIDDIYFGQADEIGRIVDKALYYQFIDQPMRQWFTDNVLRAEVAHKRRAIIGSMMVYD
jgi:hypothetical protein